MDLLTLLKIDIGIIVAIPASLLIFNSLVLVLLLTPLLIYLDRKTMKQFRKYRELNPLL